MSFKDLYKEMQGVMKDPAWNRSTKFRLLMVFVVANGASLSRDKREELLHLAGLGADENHQIDNLAFLNVSVVKEKQRDRETRQKLAKDEGAFELSRYERQCKLIVDQLIREQLSANDYPFVRPPPPKSKRSNRRRRAGHCAVAPPLDSRRH